MPRILGVVCEYNPFHLGHAHHLAQAREAFRADYVVCVMSTCFTQRGDAALLSPRARAAMALSCGADAVFALPAAWAVRDAEHFALGGVSVLQQLGCDAISFGSESGDAMVLHAVADLLEHQDDAFAARLTALLPAAGSYPAALAAAAGERVPGAQALLSAPNSTLAVCYLRAMLRLGAQMDVVPVERSASYHATDLSGALPSATALRGAILRGNWSAAGAAMPPAAFAILREESAASRIHHPGALDAALLARLRTMSAGEYAALPDVSEGIECRLRSTASAACTREDLLQAAKTRRYPYARLSRLAAHALLGFTDALFDDLPLPAPWLLGYRREARPLLSLLAGRTRMLARSGDLDPADPLIAAEMRAYDLWALGAGMPAGLARTQGVAVV